MKNIWNKLISMVLVITLLVTGTSPALAAPTRAPAKVNYLSEVAIIEAAGDEEAQKILAELQTEAKGGFTGMIALDLNKGGQKQIYLAYKTSTNVDDAITDLAIMNMEGNFSMGNYEQVLAENMNKFAEVASDYRTIAKEFAAQYAAGNVNAKTAYRQMNLYYVQTSSGKTYMGDYMLNFPSSNESFAEILFRGNLNIISNLQALMAMSVGNGDITLATRIAEAYAAAETDPSVYETSAYRDAAKSMKADLETMKKNVNNMGAEIAKIEADTTLDAETKDFAKETLQNSLDMANAFLELLKEIPMGETTLGDFIMNTATIEATQLYPIAAAATEAERLLMEYHCLYEVLLYDVLELCGEELEAALQELEAGVEPLSVYHGVQNDMVTGTIGITGDAEIYKNSSGKSFFGIFSNDATQAKSIAFTVMGAAGLASMVAGVAYLGAKLKGLAVANAAKRVLLQGEIDTAQRLVDHFTAKLEPYLKMSKIKQYHNQYWIEQHSMNLKQQQKNLIQAKSDINNSSSYAHLSGKQIALGGGLILAGLVMMGLSIWQLTETYNKFVITYTDIPDNMVDVVSYEDGDRFVNYKNVRAYYYEDGTLKNRENDLNAYDGRQWVSLYYTKNYEAGYCLTASPDLIATEAGKTGYTSLHLFGRSDGYNTNSYCNRDGAEAVYLAFKYSTNQKSAVTDVPDIVGSVFNSGVIAISSLVGFAGGIILTASINKKKQKAAAAAEA